MSTQIFTNNKMLLLYDGTFEGLLTVIFECYAQKISPIDICNMKTFQDAMFSDKKVIMTDIEKAQRVWMGWQKKLSSELNQLPYQAFISEEDGMELKILHFARYSFSSPVIIEGDYGDPDILDIRKAARRVNQEAMRMLQFVRFQRTKDDIYFSGVRPRYDVLPMTIKHFKDRFADQLWLVYDLKRDYGFYYNRQRVEELKLEDKTFNTQDGKVPLDSLMEEEANYQGMWNNYCQSITIRERLNLQLQRQHMPKRYWQFLPEMRTTGRK